MSASPMNRAVRAAFLACGLFVLGAYIGPVGTGGTVSAAAQPSCDRACLQGHVDRFLVALLAHNPGAIPVTDTVQVIYNGKPATLGGNDVWKAIDRIDFHQYAMDTTTEQVAFYGVAVEANKRGTLYLRLVPETTGKLSLIEITAGARRLDGVPGLISPNPFFDYVLPPSQRRSRTALVRIADDYFEALEEHDGSRIPITEDCRRFEDGVQTTRNPFMVASCSYFTHATYIDATANRIYPVVDEARGLVLGQMVIQASRPSQSSAAARYRPNPLTGMVMWLDEYFTQPHDTIIHQLFKVVDGKVAEIQTYRLDRPYGWGGGWSGERRAIRAN